MSATIKHFNVIARKPSYPEATLCVVLYADHLASHAYDEEKERALFEASMREDGFSDFRRSVGSSECYLCHDIDDYWHAWKLCAKSRAKAAGCE